MTSKAYYNNRTPVELKYVDMKNLRDIFNLRRIKNEKTNKPS